MARMVAFPLSVVMLVLALIASASGGQSARASLVRDIARGRAPVRDLDAFKAVPPPAAVDWVTDGGPLRQVWVASGPDGEYVRTMMRLVGTSERFRVWLQDDSDQDVRAVLASVEKVDGALDGGLLGALDAAARSAKPNVYPVEVLFVELEAMGGYFSSADQPGSYGHPYSNRANAIYIGLASCNDTVGCSAPLVAHELQHLLQSQVDARERTWVNEGLSETAEKAVAAEEEQQGPLRCSDIPLLEWAEGGEAVGMHYRASESFMGFWGDRYGEDALAELAVLPIEGTPAFGLYLLGHGAERGFEGAFLGWVDEQYRLWAEAGADPGLCPPLDGQSPSVHVLDGESSVKDTVSQYGCDYVVLESDKEVEIAFSGATEASVIAGEPRDGAFWWSNRLTQSETSLTRELDLRGVTAAHLEFTVWYDLEESYDWGYIAASEDGGRTWRLLESDGVTSEDPFGNNPGWGFTGQSDDWVRQVVDLAPFAGKRILLRFGCQTDDAYERPGLAIDDIAVPEIGWRDTADTPGGWQAEGFLRIHEPLRQRFSLRLAESGGQGQSVRELQLGGGNDGQWALPAAPKGSRRALLVCGLAEGAAEPAPYSLTVIPAG